MSERCFCHIVDGEGNKYAVKDATARAEIEKAKVDIEEAKSEIEELKNNTPSTPETTIELVYVTPQMFGAKGDGVADDTMAIQSALDNSSYVYIPDGVYIINATNSGWGHQREGGIYPRSNQTIVLSNNAILKAKDNTTGFYNIVNITDVENVHIIGGKIQGIKTDPTRVDPAPGGEFGYGIATYGASNITIENMEIFDCWGDSVVVGYSTEDSYNIKVYGCVLHDSRRQGISIIGCNTAIIRDCEIYNIAGTNPQYGIDIEPDGIGSAINITIDGCYIHDNAVGSIVIPDTENTESANVIKEINVTNCRLKNFNSIGGRDVKISNSIVERLYLSANEPIRVTNTSINKVAISGGSAVIDNCEIRQNTSGYVIELTADNFPTKRATVYFYNSIITCNDGSGYMVLSTLGDSTGMPAKLLSFTNCVMKIGGSCSVCNRLPADNLVMDGCKLTFTITPSFAILFSGSTSTAVSGKAIFNNTEFEITAPLSNLVYVGNNTSVDLEITNCKIPNITNFLYSEDSTSKGKIKLFNNEMSAENIKGSGVFEKEFINTFLTESELSNKGYLTLNTLPKYEGGVA